MNMVQLNKQTIIKIFTWSFLVFFVLGIIPQTLSSFAFIFQKSDTSFISFFKLGFFFVIIFPSLFFLGGLLIELPYFFIYENKIYNNENKIIDSGFIKTKDFKITKSTLMLKTFQKDFNQINVLIIAEYSLLLKSETLLEFKSEIENISEKLFYFFRSKSRINERYEYSLNDITYVIDLKNESLNIENILEGFDEFDIEKEKLSDPYETYSDWV
jgi:hypothetical protein